MLNPIFPNTYYRPTYFLIEYPPDHDSELHIWAYKNSGSINFTLQHAIQKNEFTKTDETEWENLVRAARGIIAQDERNK